MVLDPFACHLYDHACMVDAVSRCYLRGPSTYRYQFPPSPDAVDALDALRILKRHHKRCYGFSVKLDVWAQHTCARPRALAILTRPLPRNNPSFLNVLRAVQASDTLWVNVPVVHYKKAYLFVRSSTQQDAFDKPTHRTMLSEIQKSG